MTVCRQCFVFHSVISHCWLGGKKDKWSVKYLCLCHLSPHRFSSASSGERKLRDWLTEVHLENRVKQKQLVFFVTLFLTLHCIM